VRRENERSVSTHRRVQDNLILNDPLNLSDAHAHAQSISYPDWV